MEQQDLFTEKEDNTLMIAFAWWEKKRILYNIVGITGICIILITAKVNLPDLLSIIFYGIIANVFYCLGFLIEVGAKHYFKSEVDFKEKRKTIFWIGLILSWCITIFLGLLIGLLT